MYPNKEQPQPAPPSTQQMPYAPPPPPYEPPQMAPEPYICEEPQVYVPYMPYGSCAPSPVVYGSTYYCVDDEPVPNYTNAMHSNQAYGGMGYPSEGMNQSYPVYEQPYATMPYEQAPAYQAPASYEQVPYYQPPVSSHPARMETPKYERKGFEPASEPEVRTHIVKRGDTLYKIAHHHGVSWQELARFNQLSNPRRLYIGQRIMIPR